MRAAQMLAVWFALTCAACTGLGDFPTPSCDHTEKLQALELPTDVTTLAQAGDAFVLQTPSGEPRALAQLSRDGSWEQRALDARTLCGEDAACSVSGLALAPLAAEYVLAITLQPTAAECSRLRLVLADKLPDPKLHGGDDARSVFHGVRPDARGCTRGGVLDARVAGLVKEPTRDVLVVWRAAEPAVAEGPCAQVGDSYITALSVSVPQDGLGLFSDERESLRCLGVSSSAPSVVASKRADGYFVGFLESTGLHVQFVPAYGAQRSAVESVVWPFEEANSADRLGLALSADETRLAAYWVAAGSVHLAAFEVAADLTLRFRSSAVLPVQGRFVADPLVLRVDTGLLDWSGYQIDAGWLLMWLSGTDDTSRLYAARVSDRTGSPLAAPAQLAAGRLSMPIAAHRMSGALYGFVRYDKTDLTVKRAELALYSTECVIAARL